MSSGTLPQQGSGRVAITYAGDSSAEQVRCTIEVTDASLQGHAAELRLVRKVLVRDDRPVHASSVFYRAQLTALRASNEILIPRHELRAYCYDGEKISIEVHTELKIDDGRFFDTTIRQQEELLLLRKPQVASDAKGMIDPKDAFCFISNLAAIPMRNRIITLGLALVGLVVIVVNTAIGVRDQFVPQSMTWIYSHYDSDGDSQSPFLTSLIGSGVAGAAVWFAMRKQLRKYMTFGLGDVPPTIGRNDVVDAMVLLHGRSRVPLENIIVRIVACNMEKGQYTRGSGTNERTVSFTHPVRAIVLYEVHIPHVPAHAPVEDYLRGTIEFEPMFRALYPPQEVSNSHGIAVHWEAQLIHEKFVDHELICPRDCFVWEGFLEA